jgi:hypothetical protein
MDRSLLFFNSFIYSCIISVSRKHILDGHQDTFKDHSTKVFIWDWYVRYRLKTVVWTAAAGIHRDKNTVETITVRIKAKQTDRTS